MSRIHLVCYHKNMFKSPLNSFIALAMVAAVGIGASYLIIRFATATDFSYISTNDSITISAEFQKNQRGGE